MAGGPEWESLLAPLLSGTLGAAVARFLISSTLKKIAEVPDEIAKIKTQLAVILEKVEGLVEDHDEIKELVYKHDKSVAVMEDRLSAIKRTDRSYKS